MRASTLTAPAAATRGGRSALDGRTRSNVVPRHLLRSSPLVGVGDYDRLRNLVGSLFAEYRLGFASHYVVCLVRPQCPRSGHFISRPTSGDDAMKRCTTCREVKPLESFVVDRRKKSGRGARCSDCQKAYMRAQYASGHRSPKVAGRINRRNELLTLQDGICAVCGSSEPGSRYGWQLDHDHSCCPGKTWASCGRCDRGVLCQRCNLRLSVVEDAVFMAQAHRYLAVAA